MSLNVVALMGRLVADPEIRSTNNNNSSVCNFRIAVERAYVKQGEERKSDFFSVVVFGQSADFVSKFFHKGDMIALNGRLQQSEWQDKDGNRRTSIDIVADAVSFTGSRNANANNASANANAGNNGGGNSYNNNGNNGYNNSRSQCNNSNNGENKDYARYNPNDGDLPF